MAQNDVTIKVDADNKSFLSKMGKVKLAMAAVGAGIVVALKKSIDAAAKLEVVQTRFEVLAGSSKKAEKHVRDLLEFSAKTPFQFEGLADASALLQAFDIHMDDSIGKLREIGDVAAATGKPIKSIATIYGQISVEGKLTWERLKQLGEGGVPVLRELAKHYGKSKKEVIAMTTAGEISSKVFQDVFAGMSKEGGFAFGGMEKQSETLTGKISTLKDRFQILFAEIGKRLLPTVKKVTTAFSEFIGKIIKNPEKFDVITVAIGKMQAYLKDAGETAKIVAGFFWKLYKPLHEFQMLVAKISWHGLKEGFNAAVEGAANLANKITGEDKRIADMKKKYGDQIVSDEKIKTDALIDEQKRLKEETKKIAENKRQEEEEAQKAKEERERAALERKMQAEYDEDEAERERLRGKMEQDIFYKNEKVAVFDEENNVTLMKNKKALKKFNELTKSEKQKGFDNIARMAKSEDKTVAAIGKAAAIRNATIKGYEAVMGAYAFGASLPGGPITGAIMAAAATVFAAEQVSAIAGVKLYDGGTVMAGLGRSSYRDSVPAQLAVGETVVSRNLTQKLANMADNQGISNYDNRTSVMIEGNLIVDDDERMDALIERINERVEDGNLRLVSSATRK